MDSLGCHPAQLTCYSESITKQDFAMKSFIERNPKEKAVEDSFTAYARAGYPAGKADPADNVFDVVARLKRQSRRKRMDVDNSPSI